jgi:hypothetical protein
LHPDDLNNCVLRPILAALRFAGGLAWLQPRERDSDGPQQRANDIPAEPPASHCGEYHNAANTTMRYTQVVSEDERRLAEVLDDMYLADSVQMPTQGGTM